MAMINIRLEDSFLKDIDNIVKENNFNSRTELIRHSLREEIERRKMKQSILKLRGSSNTKTTDEEIRKIKTRMGNKILSQMS